MSIVLRVAVYLAVELVIAFLAVTFMPSDWVTPVLASLLLVTVVELVVQVYRFNKLVRELHERLPLRVESMEPAIIGLIQSVDADRNKLAYAANAGAVPASPVVSSFLAEQFEVTNSSFCSVSAVGIDADLWSSPARSIPYLEAHRRAAKRGVSLRRIFVAVALHEVFEWAASQREYGIAVRFLALTDSDELRQDLGIFDARLTYFNELDGRSWLSDRVSVVEEKLRHFEILWDKAEEIPSELPNDSALGLEVYRNDGSQFGSRNTFGKKSLLHAWDEGVDTNDLMTPAIADASYQKFLLGLCSFQRRELPDEKLMRVLSIGAGAGTFEVLLRDELNADVTCIDVLEESLELLQKKGLKALKGSVANLALILDETDQYDLILMDGLVVHLGDYSLKRALVSCQDYLSEHGVILVSTDSPSDSRVRSQTHPRVRDGILRSLTAIDSIAGQAGLSRVVGRPTEFPYYRPRAGYTRRVISVLERHAT